jgi:hypothetical protein
LSAVDCAAIAVSLASVLVALIGAVARLGWRVTVPLAMDLLMAAGLLRLTSGPEWRTLAAAGALIGLRKLILSGIARGSAALT